jgi:hypothetical protein
MIQETGSQRREGGLAHVQGTLSSTRRCNAGSSAGQPPGAASPPFAIRRLSWLRNCSKYFFVIVAGGLICCSGCSSSNPSEVLQHEQKTIISWVETARMVGGAWKNGLVPQAYADRTFQTAQQSIQSEAQTIQSLSIADTAKADLLAKLSGLHDSLGQGVVAVKNDDRAALNITLDQLTVASAALGASPTLKLPRLPTP